METVTTTSYNEHGDKSEVCIIGKDNSAFPAGVPYALAKMGRSLPPRQFLRGPRSLVWSWSQPSGT
jgi:hypothetical protein